ncbi:MAG TPA: glycosyl transferase family 4 [Candidatus Paceibacterota bacterium]|nr:glycosyl transferase family 4 [Candidatus Paceibacterota bacterium]
MEELLIISLIISFGVVALLMPFWIKKAKQIGLIWDDMNKIKSEKVTGSGGIIVLLGFTLGVLSYIAIKTFYFKSGDNLIEIFSMLCVMLIVAIIGLIDDLLGWQHGGLSAKVRIILVAFAAIPLMVINAGHSEMYLPFIGNLNIGIIYALIVIPIAIVGCSTTFNFLAGFNGLEARQGILILSALAIISYIGGNSWLSIIALCMVLALLGFLIYNKIPAKVFPGDVMTYPIGALIAIMAILGNYERFALFIFIPYILETGLKLRGKLKKQSFGEPQNDGSLKNKYKHIYGLEHFAIWILEKIKPSKKVYEKDVVNLINLFQIIIIIFGFLIFFYLKQFLL